MQEDWLAIPMQQSGKTIADAFSGSPSVTYDYHPGLVIEDGVVISYTGSGGVVVIPEGVTEIAEKAFQNKKNVTEVALPSTLKIIGNRAFNDAGIKTITLPASVESIGLYVFNYAAEGYVGLYVSRETFDAYKEMYMAMYSEIKGRMHIISAYRSYARQSELYNKAVQNLMAQGKTSTEARALALNTTQTPGNSEHQLGNTIDVSNDNTTDHDYLETPEGKWLAENCYKYGFIIRYPENKSDITRIDYEPWHIRYVGVNHAAYMYVNDLCLEQYVVLQEQAQEEADDYALKNPATPD